MTQAAQAPTRARAGSQVGSLIEFVLVAISAWAVAAVVENAFFLDGMVATFGWAGRAAITFVVVAILLGVMFVPAIRRGSPLVRAVAFLVVAAVIIIGSFALSTGETVYDDAEGNYLYFALVCILCAGGAYVLSRTLMGSMAWFVVAAFACALTQALYQPEELGLSIVAVFFALVFVVFKNFQLGRETAELTSASSSAGSLAFSFVPVIVAAGVAALLWFCVIGPLSPGTIDIKLLTDYRSLPIEEYVGTSEEHALLNYDMTSSNLVDGFYYTTNDLVEDPTSSITIDAKSLLEQQEKQAMGQGSGSNSGGGFEQAPDDDSLDGDYDAVSYTIDFPTVMAIIGVLVLIVLAIVAYFLLRRRARMKRLRSILELEPAAQVEELYRFILTRLDRIGFAQPEGMTLIEFAQTSQRPMDMITEETGVPFVTLTRTYISCVYGGYEPTESDVVPFAAYYLRFWKAARTHLGNLKYFFASFRL